MKLLIINNMHSNSNAWVEQTVLLLQETESWSSLLVASKHAFPSPSQSGLQKFLGRGKVCFCTDNVWAQQNFYLQNGNKYQRIQFGVVFQVRYLH